MNADERRYSVVKNIFKYICHGLTQNFYLKNRTSQHLILSAFICVSRFHLGL